MPTNPNDAPNFWIALLGFLTSFFFFIPGLIIGGVFYFFIRDSYPLKARSFGKGMLWCLRLIPAIAFLTIVLLTTLGSPVQTAFNTASDSLGDPPTRKPVSGPPAPASPPAPDGPILRGDSAIPTTADFDKATLEGWLVGEYNAQLQTQGAGFTCTSVTLMAMDDKTFEGYANLSNGGRMPMTVTLGQDGIIWRAIP